jgi:hypothetical protein
MNDPLDMLRRLRAGCAVRRPLDPALAGWLAASLDRYLARDADSLEAALGLASGHGGLSWRRREAIRERNEALRTLAAGHFAHLPPAERARALASAASRYGACAWRLDRQAKELPAAEALTRRGLLFRAFRSGAAMPLGERQIRNILREKIPDGATNGQSARRLDNVADPTDRP